VSSVRAGWAELLAVASSIRSDAIAREPGLSRTTIVAVGWATVEADRARREFDGLLGTAVWLPLERDPLLGARPWRRSARPPADGDVDLLVLEPDTEGRIAAFLARFGEGVAVVCVRGAGSSGDLAGAAGRLVAGGPAWGPHVVVLGDR